MRGNRSVEYEYFLTENWYLYRVIRGLLVSKMNGDGTYDEPRVITQVFLISIILHPRTDHLKPLHG